MNILFRTDSSSTIGTGHIMRDLVLAEQFKDANIIFATQDLSGNINHKIEEKDHTIKILNSNDIEELINIIKKYSIEMIVIDHYEIDHDYEKALKEITGITIYVLDDTYKKHYCDILLNHNIYADNLRYKSLVPENCELRCGADFTLLREEFKFEKTKQSQSTQEIKNIFIAMGGADHSNLNIKILKILEDFTSIHVNVVTTTANKYLTELQDYILDKDNVTLYINTNHIANLMNEADFAIVTPSVTLNEIVYLNVPFIAIKTAYNQDEMYMYLTQHGYSVLEKFNATVLKSKIENTLDSIKTELINFIDLSIDEKKMVLMWRNDPNIRKWMFAQEIISLNDHLNYIDSLEEKEDRTYFLVKKASQAIGVIDFTNIDNKNKRTEFGIYSNPEIKGVGNSLMNSIIDYAFNKLKINTLVSEVFDSNNAAISLYIRYSFEEIEVKKVNGQSIVCMELKNENR
ncbi:MAG: UDP-2,4-diacetamido-2,4,6-trideoxy-beta-L-altropyranose hydrolase [Candidatus Delongbacteria bacterium]|jgi:UDP-2,4-diacetamido-2,4,6-trideoxy-beta-L-altropyranose hydrolase|nr:UDP-2,4-diacetamido-2,4,6-trideoxy-beta-L-altropyranose hydrolase [Candidatus Delongbacteria bacterium]